MEDFAKMQHKLQEFSKINEKFGRTFKVVEAKKDLKVSKKIKCLLNFIANEVLIHPQYFESVLEHFANELPSLLSTAITFTSECPFNQPRHIVNCILLSKTVKARTDLKGFALKYFGLYASPFEESTLTTFKSKRSKFAVAENVFVRDVDVVEACYFLLLSEPKFYKQKWKWSGFIKSYSISSDSQVVWLSCHIIGIVLNLKESDLKALLAQRLSEEDILRLSIEFDRDSSFTRHPQDSHSMDQKPLIPFKSETIGGVEKIAGIYIPALDGPKKKLLFEVSSTFDNLRKIALGLSSGRALCLQGPVGCGKTGLVEHLAACTGRQLGENFIKVQLGDQTDSKMLLGTYRCTDTPGEFIWQPGVLTQAVLQGSWLLLEDIDLSSMDIASVLASLLENKALTVPGYRDLVPVSPGFQLFLTQRVTTTVTGHHQKRYSNAMQLLDKQLLQITIDPLTSAELKEILHLKYPRFDTVADRLVNVFQLFSNGNSDEILSPHKRGRLISTRDFFKWCSRASIDYDVKSQESALKILQDAIDVFCCSLPDAEDSLSLAKNISSHLGIIVHKAEYFFKNYKPTVTLNTNTFVSGRATLTREHSKYSKQAQFCFTRPAAVLLERIMCCVMLKEPVLLVGETGTGKTSSVQYLARTLGKKLIVINMNQQSDSADLLGGFKPIDLKIILGPLRMEFEAVFKEFFDTDANKEFLKKVAFAFNKQKYSYLVSFMKKSTAAALKRLTSSLEAASEENKEQRNKCLLAKWQTINEKLRKVESQMKHSNALFFAFIEGSLVKAVQQGSWVLLDEINLANAETLECLSGLLEDSSGSLCLLERGDKKPVNRHQNFTLFACMNPATNVGKKDLPVGLRNRFTEFFVQELTEKSDLMLLVNSYLQAACLKEMVVSSIVNFYLKVRAEMVLSLSDGMGHKPHFSLRSLCRALMIASKNPCGNMKRSLYEAFCLSFLTQLDAASYVAVQNLITTYIVSTEKQQLKSVLNQPILEPQEAGCSFLQFEDYWIKKGSLEPQSPDNYILTKSVRKNLKDLVRVVSIGKLPVLLQGDTSVGKTSLITYLAKSSGNKCVRINNHEHTDLQEYIGSYVADAYGKLVFREGVLVEAMRKGHWIILDELNLAPTEVLEALNRVLDDNRELFIPETQETVTADPNFMLFATQNPPGAYGGRKMLSRAFRNRFVELHFNEIPADELETILHNRCLMPPSYAKRMIKVMTELQLRRRGSAAFAGKQGFITLRDLFRWGDRYRLAPLPSNLHDWNQHLVDEGYLVLAGKVRKEDERKEICEALSKHWQREVCLNNLFSLHEKTSSVTKHILQKLEENSSRYPNIVWTLNMRKLAVLAAKALEFKEPVLLVGETGGGKTTICQLIAENNGQELAAVNCHMHTESSDFIGGLRPVREHSDKKALFEWVDGPLLVAMLKGNVFLADEISLADDSVLERLNSLLEPERTLLLAEKAIDLNNPNNSETVVAHPDFVFIGTMNPGGDFGKKELSPALRNRFTEIWCDSCTDRDDLILIINRNLTIKCDFGSKMMDFIEWFRGTEIGKRYTISIRDILTWVSFVNRCSGQMSAYEAYLHGARLVFLDSMGSGATSTEKTYSLRAFKLACENMLNDQVAEKVPELESRSSKVICSNSQFGITPFCIALGEEQIAEETFSFEAPTTIENTLNLLRGMQLNKAILLEGSPGVGKTSLVTALAKCSRHRIFRVNLSDQTDISDLFGADLPVEGGTGGQFAWKDGPLLQALKEGSWILLDELNLASQSVLEGLNACLDHRGEIFIPELGKTFHVKTGTRFFACQNPMKQGGSRRGLPKSFLNRFIQVYVSPFAPEDMEVILGNQFPNIGNETVKKMIAFNYKLASELDQHLFGNKGGPWECNLRDLTRWCQATLYHFDHNPCEDREISPESTIQLIYVDRMRSVVDKTQVERIFQEVFGRSIKGSKPMSYIEEESVHFGDVKLKREQDHLQNHGTSQNQGQLILREQLSALRSLSYCVNQNWMAILVGNSGVGKSSVVKTLANLAGKTLKTLPVTSAMDTTDILGGFEQTNYSRHLEEIAQEAERQTLATVQSLLMEEKFNKAALLLEHWEEYLVISDLTGQTMEEEVQLFVRRVSKLEGLLKELYMKSNSTGDGNVILHLLDKCSKILDRVNGDKSLSAGGRFEWVNSILVKCLQEGSWLLVDNVNLCSAAVLDRLNALLEPNGVLTISERGVDNDGKMFEVKPHPDFRIFLTMDPKNGEISRAMRNRGVEIYMLNSSYVSSSNQYDIKSLIDLEGLSNPNHIEVLLKVHEFISGLILSDHPNSTEILSCASLISQQLHHGIDVFEAFCTTCIEVYYKTRNPSEFNCNNVLEVIAEGIRRCFQESELWDFYNRNVTLNTTNFAKWSMLEKVKQQSAIYQSALKRFNQEKPLEVLKRSYRLAANGQEISIWSDIDQLKMQNDFFISSHFYTLANLLVIDYTLSSNDDVEYRTIYLRTITSQPEWQGALELFSKITKYFQWTNPRLPYDDRWINDRGINSSSSNAINYALQIELHKLKDAFQIKYATQNSVYNYLHALKTRQVTDAFTSPICTNYLALRSEHFMFMRQLCTHFTNDGSLNQTVVKVLELLSWRQSLQGFLTSVRVPNQTQKSPRAFQGKLEALALYYKWFYKHSVTKVAELLETKVPDSLNSILVSINEHLEEHFSKSYKIAANYKKHNTVPEFYTMDWQLGALEFLQSYDLFNLSTNVSRTLALFKRSQEFRSTLIGLKSNIYSNADLSSELSQLKTFKENTATEQCLKIQERESLPLVDALTEMLLLQIIKAIYSKKELNLAALDNNILVNVDFNGALLKFKTTGNERFLHEIKKEFYSAASYCPSARPSKFIDGADNAQIGLSIAGVEPVFSKTIIQLLVDLDNKCATLSNCKAVEEQRNFLRLLLWDNIHALSSDTFDFINNQHALLKNNLKNVLSRLQECLKLSNISLDNLSTNDFKDPVLRKTIEYVQSSYLKLKTGLASTTREECVFSYMADIHLNLGFAELYLNSLLPRVDPLAKKAMKKNHIVSVIGMFEQMKLSFELQNGVFGNEECTHPYVQPIKNMIQDLQSKLVKYGESNNIGVKSCSYSQVVQQVTHARSNIFKLTVLDDINNCTKMVENLPNQPYSEEVMNKIQHYIDMFESSVPSFETIIQDWKQLRGFYPDIIEPLLANIFQFLYGFKLKLFWIKREVLKFQYNIQFKVNLENELLRLAELPSLNGNVASLNALVEAYTVQRDGPFMNYILCAEQPAYVKQQEYVRLLKCEIQESFNQCLISAKTFREIDQNLLNKFNELVETFISLWNAQQENIEREKAEAGSLYKTRTKCDDKTEEELIEEELKELLPNHHVLDFSDLQPQTLSDSAVEVEVETDDKRCGLMTDEELMFVVDLHSKLFKNFIRAEWLIPEPNKHILPDYVSPLMEKYKLARRLMDNHRNYFQYTLDKQLCASLAVLLEVSGKYDSNELHVEPLSPKIHNKKIKDFYKDADVDEVKPCITALNVLKIKVNELLEEWPEQPTLKTILTIIDRILNFDIKSPISRFLTGFDILLSKCHEWEEVAHSGVSLRNSTPELTAQIITWRKLELSRWKDLLSTTFTGLNKPLSKWWLYMYNLLKQYMHSDEVKNLQLIDTLQTFITKSPIAEFHGRLEMLLEFHCHAIGLPRSPESDSFISIIWNVFNYFNQFSTVITNKMKDLRSPIERKLKDYLKIVRWKDINYWSIRNTVDKTHKMLHKFVREYKGLLSQPVTPFLTNPVSENLIDNVGIWDRPQRQNPKPYHYTLDADSYMAKASIKDFAYLAKARKIAKETILSTEYPELLKCLDGFVTDVIETSSHLKNLEIDTTLTKEKQKSQAKNILHQKHRALADLFQSLSKMGVSFKTGLIDMKLKNPADNFTIKPIDLSASLTFLGLNSMDGKILTIWDSCELYYYRSVMRCEILHTALLTPAPDLGMQNIDRCRGFAAHLLTICQQQKVSLIEATRSHYVLRGYAKQMREFCEYSSLISFKTLEDIQKVLGSLAVVTSQLQLIVNSCPEEQNEESQYIAIPQLKPDSDKLKRKGDENWKKANKSLNGINSLSAKMLQVMHKNAYYQPHTSRDVVKPKLLPFAHKDQLHKDLLKVNEYLNNLKLIFDPIKVVESINWVSKSITLILEEGFKDQVLDSLPEHSVDQLLQNFTKTILIKIQNVYKKYKEPRSQDDTEEELQLKPNHLKLLLTDSLAEDFQTFDLDNVLTAAEAVLTVLLGKSAQVSENIINKTAKSLALFDQVLRLSEYFITQQVAAYRITCKLTSILINIFIDLASKGFCVPPELSDEMDKEGVSKPSNGMGLGDGQGEKDVSDRIESEDQLDDAQPANQEKETDEDPDCKEEDNAIEMSEDFDSKLQDKKPTGEDEEDQDNQNSDAEEQMGETEKGADQLDQEIWGEDKENDNEENDDLDEKEEDGKGGEKDGEDQLEAKGDKESKEKPERKEPSEDQTEDSEKNKKEINEMNEPEFDDEQTDPYHGNQPELPEPEPMDLPDDLQLDEGEGNDEEQPEENPFDIDEMKDQQVPEDQPEDQDGPTEEDGTNDEEKGFSSDDEDVTRNEEGDNIEDDESERPNTDEKPPEPDKIEEASTQDGDDPIEEANEEQSALDETPSNQENIEAMEVEDKGATDKTQATQAENMKSEQPIDDTCQEDKPDKEGMGQSQMEESETGHSVQSSAQQEAKASNSEKEEEKKRKERPGQSDLKRSLGDVNEPVEKRLKTMEAKENDNSPQEEAEKQKADMYQHIQEATKDKTKQVLDAATKDQVEEQKKEAVHEENGADDDEMEVDGSNEVPEDQEDKVKETVADTLKENNTKSEGNSKQKQQHPEGEAAEEIADVEIEGEIVKTLTVPRGLESSYYTQYHLLQEKNFEKLTQEEINEVRAQVEQELSTWKSAPTNMEAEQTWQKISSVTSSLAQDLSEQLRLVLEPTQASHLRGDFRTGRRINMRKVIPYIASQFRKDKIWLRRTKPSKREYQIVLAIDDSASMADNHSKELAFESVALISKALSLLESGQLAVVSFGETTEIHHKLTEPFTDKCGVQLLQNFQFDQQKTYIGKLVNFVTEMFEQNCTQSSIPNAKLLLIVSDGQGVFSEGQSFVTRAVRRAKLANIFTVFVIIDNPKSRSSVLDIKSTIFKDGKFVGFQNYMDRFPFPFYLILRDINSLPGVLSDALMQWFEMITSQQ